MLKTLWKDFLAQRWLMKLALIWGWLAIVIMLGALFAPYFQSLELLEALNDLTNGS